MSAVYTSMYKDYVVENVPRFQGGGKLIRHRCAKTAFEIGMNDSIRGEEITTCKHGSSCPTKVLMSLEKNQGNAPFRHRCPVCSYEAGLALNISENKPSKFGSTTRLLKLINRVISPRDAILSSKKKIVEGGTKVVQLVHTKIERNPALKKRALEIHGTNCYVCDFNANEVYGPELGRDYIEMHHVNGVSDVPKEVDVQKDVVMLCANCHRIAHPNNQTIIDVKKVKEAYEANKRK